MNVNTLLGAPLIGVWASSMLYAAILHQTWFYVKNFPRDSFWLKSLVGTSFILTTASLATDYVGTYLLLVTHWGDVAFLEKEPWTLGATAAFTGILGFLSQCFLTWRYYTLTRHWIVTLAICVLVLAALASCEASAIILEIFNSVSQRNNWKIQTMARLYVASSAGADFFVSVALSVYLYRMKTSFAQTDSLVKRLINQTIQTGSVSSMLAIAALIPLVVDDNNNLPIPFLYLLGQSYLFTLLSNLNIRKSFRNDDSIFVVQSNEDSKRTRSDIQVLHHTFVHMDSAELEGNTERYKSSMNSGNLEILETDSNGDPETTKPSYLSMM